ncbi:unnamed protein product [Sympodiomycopsis kandeliae]
MAKIERRAIQRSARFVESLSETNIGSHCKMTSNHPRTRSPKQKSQATFAGPSAAGPAPDSVPGSNCPPARPSDHPSAAAAPPPPPPAAHQAHSNAE